jgi:hypothetical protein
VTLRPCLPEGRLVAKNTYTRLKKKSIKIKKNLILVAELHKFVSSKPFEMKSLSFLFMACLFSTYGFTQDTTDIYLDEYGLRITKEEFNALADNNVGYFYLEGITENGRVFFVEKRTTFGRVSPQVVNDLRTHLQKLSESEINEKNYLVVNYYPGPDPCNQSGNMIGSNSRLRSYHKRISRQKNVSQFFIYKIDKGLGIKKEHLTWYPDKNNLWQSHFFKHHYPCDSFVIVKPDGQFLLVKGEYDTRQVFRGLKKLKRLD